MCTRDRMDQVAETSRSDSGAIALIVAIAIVALLGVTALSTDVGYLYSHRRALQTAADAAALAGVQDLPTNTSAARTEAINYVGLNTRAADSVETSVTISQTWAPNDTITVEVVDPDASFFFGRALGLTTTEVSARAVARVGSPVTYSHGVMPFGVMALTSLQSPYGYTTGTEIDLIVPAADASGGNWHYMDLTPFSTESNTKSVIATGGSMYPISIGDYINTQTGEVTNPNFAAISNYFELTCKTPHGLNNLYRDPVTGFYEPKHLDGTPCRRLIVTPVIRVPGSDPFNWSAVKGNSEVQVIGFLNMFVGNNPSSKVGEGNLRVTFVQTIPDRSLTPGPWSPFAGVITWLDK